MEIYIKGTVACNVLRRKSKDICQSHMKESYDFTRQIMKKAQEEQKKTVDYFVSEIARIQAQMDRLAKSKDIADLYRIKRYEGQLYNLNFEMNKKYSEKEILSAKAKFHGKPNPFIFDDDNQR